MIQYAEKRDLLRMPIDCEMNFSQKGSDKLYEGHVINLSSKGILFTSNKNCDQGELLEIILTPSNSMTLPIEALAVVTRVTHIDTVYEIACEIEGFK